MSESHFPYILTYLTRIFVLNKELISVIMFSGPIMKESSVQLLDVQHVAPYRFSIYTVFSPNKNSISQDGGFCIHFVIPEIKIITAGTIDQLSAAAI